MRLVQCLLLQAVVVFAQAPSSYRVVDLGLASDVEATAINQRGQITGNRFVNGVPRPFTYDQSFKDLPILNGGFPATAYAINNKGAVVGSYCLDADCAATHAFLLDSARFTDLVPTTGVDSWAVGINETGQVIGTLDLPGGITHGFVWQSGSLQDIGPFAPIAINSPGHIVAKNVATGLPVFYVNGSITNLGSLQFACCINDADTIAGGASLARLPVHQQASIAQGNSVSNLPLVGDYWDYAAGLNNNGQVVGTDVCLMCNNPFLFYGLLWSGGSVSIISNLLQPSDRNNWWVNYATGINSRGDIIGTALRLPIGFGPSQIHTVKLELLDNQQ
jgi:probable HAF family extracellular repeat protein